MHVDLLSLSRYTYVTGASYLKRPLFIELCTHSSTTCLNIKEGSLRTTHARVFIIEYSKLSDGVGCTPGSYHTSHIVSDILLRAS